MALTWILERDVFEDQDAGLARAGRDAGHRVIEADESHIDRLCSAGVDGPAVFHGSLGQADRLARSRLTPGAFCRASAFSAGVCHARLGPDSVQRRVMTSTVAELIASPGLFEELAKNGQVFVRPDSPLKPFSGRVVMLDGLTGADLDLGFYYDDPALPILIAPVLELGPELRFIVADGEVVAGSGYEATTRAGVARIDETAEQYAREVAARIKGPERIYGLDVAECEGGWRVVELNPFSGMDLYACDRAAVVAAVERILTS